MHRHGQVYRAKIVSTGGLIEFSDWFDTEIELREAMPTTTRQLGKRYYCEAKNVACLELGCDVDQTPKIIASL